MYTRRILIPEQFSKFLNSDLVSIPENIVGLQ